MRCPFCLHGDTEVIDTRRLNEGETVRRRRRCRNCDRRFTTYERVELALMVIKKNGEREPYDRDKVLRGVYTACYRRPVSAQRIEELVDSIEAALRAQENREIPSSEIGDLVMQHLLAVDEVAYIRFASVYLSFSDIGKLRDAVEELIEQKQNRNGQHGVNSDEC
ncbi:MAG: transcriptional repressor NrdR [Chloroflexaceae bacterium]|nr:transcriptional repressor NrdR [Chloroflexaceae bacterium]NJL32563.1 transcriptional repressor NrdR [Chloroflexaceae bacterium]NJO07439.1 transcriptional repressor NrdR [Chloroflexaceae bacterium]